VPSNNVFPGCTLEMMQWWFAWTRPPGLRYAIWFRRPRQHRVSDQGRLDARPRHPPCSEVSDIVISSSRRCGGVEDIIISFSIPKQMGFDMTRFKAPNVAGVFGATGLRVTSVRA